MNYYKLLDFSFYENVYVNPKNIETYKYNKNSVRVRFTSGLYGEFSKSDFSNMMILEGADEY